MDGKVRLFVGLDLPDDVKRRITALPQLKLDFKSHARPDDLHITLRFLGDVPEDKIDEITEALSTMKKHSQFTLRIDGLGYFQKRDKGVLVATIEQNRKVSMLEETITGQMNRIGLAEGGRAFTPHITIARLNTDRNFDAFKKQNEKSLNVSWKVDHFHLFRSEQTDDGEKRYTSLQSFDLSPY